MTSTTLPAASPAASGGAARVAIDAEVSGGNILSMLAAMGAFRRRGEQLLADRGIATVEADGWYSLRAYVKALGTIERSIGPNTLYRVGQEIPNYIPTPPGLTTFERVVGCFGPAFDMNHRGTVAGITFEMRDSHTGIITSATPYPCAFDRGVIMGFLLKFLGVRCTVEHAPGTPCKATGGESCTHVVSLPR